MDRKFFFLSRARSRVRPRVVILLLFLFNFCAFLGRARERARGILAVCAGAISGWISLARNCSRGGENRASFVCSCRIFRADVAVQCVGKR